MILGIGIDITDIERIEGLLQRHRERFLNRVFTPHEIDACAMRHHAPTFLSGRFAAKEAAFKALGTGRFSGVSFREISVETAHGAPNLILTGKAHELARDLGVTKTHVSISHDRGCAVAVVIVEG